MLVFVTNCVYLHVVMAAVGLCVNDVSYLAASGFLVQKGVLVHTTASPYSPQIAQVDLRRDSGVQLHSLAPNQASLGGFG